MNRVIHFEIAATDLQKTTDFYKNVFGWNIQKWGNEDYYLAFTGDKNEPGIDGAFFKPKGEMPGNGFVNTIQIEDIDISIKSIEQNSGKIVVEKMTVPSIGYLAYCKDTEGNLFGIMQEDASAGK
jgi:hypothetical protein